MSLRYYRVASFIELGFSVIVGKYNDNTICNGCSYSLNTSGCDFDIIDVSSSDLINKDIDAHKLELLKIKVPMISTHLCGLFISANFRIEENEVIKLVNSGISLFSSMYFIKFMKYESDRMRK